MEQSKSNYRAYVCCGHNCGPKGSVRLLHELEAEVERQHIGDYVSVLPTGCQSHCESGPTMVVYPGPVYYQEVDAQRLERIVAEHFVGDTPVEEYFWRGYGALWKRPAWQSRAALPPQAPPRTTATLSQPHAKKGSRKRPTHEEPDDFKW